MEVDGTWHLDKTTLFLHVPHTKQGFALEMSHRWRVTHVPRSLLPRGTTWIGSQGEATLGLFTTWTEVGQEPHYRGPGVFFKPRATWDDLALLWDRAKHAGRPSQSQTLPLNCSCAFEPIATGSQTDEEGMPGSSGPATIGPLEAMMVCSIGCFHPMHMPSRLPTIY